MTRTLHALFVAVSLAAFFGCGEGPTTERDAHDDPDAAAQRGPHGGRLFVDGDFALELAIFEDGVPPEFRAWFVRGGEPLAPAEVELEVTLRRIADRVDRIAFAPRGDHAIGDRTVDEPHSFAAELVAREGGREHRFAFEAYENRVVLMPEQIEAAGIVLASAEPATIRERVVLNGRIAANEDRLVHVMPRFPGVVRTVARRLGDPVERGELLATIESNESLQTFELRAPLAGTVIAKDVVPGEFVGNDRVLFQIADLSTVWVDLDVFRRDFPRLRIGQPVAIDAGDGSPRVATKLAYLSPIGAVHSQTLLARVVLPNPDRSWRPGLFVTAEVEVGAAEVPVAVEKTALQRIRDQDVVFVVDGDTFEAQPVTLGRSDASRVEISSGLAPGQRHVAVGSFIVKAEAGKSGATHDH